MQEAWQQPVRKYGAVGPAADNKGRGEVRGTAQMTNKMNSIIIPHIEFRDTSIREAIDFLREQAAENDPSGQGVNIVLRLVPLRTSRRTLSTAAATSGTAGHRISGGWYSSYWRWRASRRRTRAGAFLARRSSCAHAGVRPGWRTHHRDAG